MTMRKMLAVLATLAILCAVLPLSTLFSAVAEDTNLVANGDFTDGINGWYASGGTVIEAADGALHGDYNENWGFIGYDITLEPNTDYVLTFDAKSINNGSVSAKLNKTDWTGTVQQSPFTFGAEWATYTWEFNSGSYGPMWLYFQSGCEASANQEIWLDNVSLVKANGGETPDEPDTPDVPADGNLLVNGDFETGDITGWDNLWGSCTVSIVEGRESNSALQMSCGEWQMVRQKVAVEKNTDYVLTIWAKDAKNLTFLVKDGGDSKNIAQTGAAEGAAWKQYTVEFNSGDYDSVFISLMGNANGATAIIDDVVLAKVGGETPDEPDTPDEPEAPADGNLIVNGDFETGDASGWETWQSTTISADAAKDGAFGAHLKGDGSWGGMLNQTMTVEAGKEYKLSFWINVNATGVNVQVMNGAGAAIEGAGGWFDANKKDTQVEWTFTATDSKVKINFCGSGAAPEDAYVDNFSLVATGNGGTPDEPEVDDALIKNGDFETGSLAPWDNLWGSCPKAEVVEGGKDSKYALNVVSKTWNHVRQTNIPVEANTNYKITAWAKNAANMCLLVKDGADTTDIANVGVAAGDEWTQFTVEFNSGSFTSIIFSLMGGEGDSQYGMFDNIVMEKVGGSEPDQPDEPDEPVTPPTGGLLDATFDGGEFDGVQSTCDISVADGELQFNVTENWGNIYAELAVEANTNYEISFRAKSKLGKNVWVKFHKADWTGDIGQADASLSTSWKDYKVTLNSGDNTSLWLLVQYAGYSSEGETIWFDYINVKKVGGGSEPDQPSTNGLVVNGDFETGDNTGWEKWQSTVINADAAYKGQYGANLIGDGGWGGLLNQTFKVENGETYVITLWICPTTGGANLQINGATKIDEESDGTWMTAGEISGWTERKFVVVANSDNITLNFCGGGNNIAADIYLDEIVVVKKGETPPVDDTYPIKNAGFETGDLTSWINLWDSCNVGFDTPGHDKSNFALNFEGPGAWNQVRQDGIPVEPNTDYTLIAYVKNPININLVVKTGNDSANIADFGVENDMSNSWIRQESPFNSGEETKVCVLIISNGDGNGSAIVDNVQIYKKGEEPAEPEPDGPATEGPIQLDSYGTAINRPAAPENNLIVNGSFEDAEGGEWQSVISDTLYVVDDETAPEGNKSLFFNTSTVKDSNKVIFYLDVEPDTDYVFSAWVKGAFISDTNRFNATFGVTDWKDNFCVYQDAKFSNKNRQIVPTAWDNEWHLRSVQFNSGVNTKIGIGFAGAESQMWIDDMALFTVDNGMKYADDRQIYYVIGSALEEGEDGTCADENNLIAGANMDSAAAEEFWSSAEGFKNGFLTFSESKYEYGTSLKYAGDEESCYTNAIKWLEVKPDTDYIFTVDIRVVQTGGGSLNLLDGKKRNCDAFLMIDFDLYSADTLEWRNYAVKFNSGEFDRIGISIVDGGGVALIDNMRLFEAANRVDGGADDYVKPPYTLGGEDDPHLPEGVTPGPIDPDSPDTGVSVLGAVVAMALVPSSAVVALKLRRKKEDEE